MKKVLLAAMTIMLLSPLAVAHAEPMPDSMLQKDFDNCMGGEDPQKSPERGAYCNCIRDKMRSWDVDTYGNIATEQMQANGKPTDSVSDLAKQCMAQVLK